MSGDTEKHAADLKVSCPACGSLPGQACRVATTSPPSPLLARPPHLKRRVLAAELRTQPARRAVDARGMENAERITRPVIHAPQPSLRDIIREWLEEQFGSALSADSPAKTALVESLAERIEANA